MFNSNEADPGYVDQSNNQYVSQVLPDESYGYVGVKLKSSGKVLWIILASILAGLLIVAIALGLGLGLGLGLSS